MTSAAEERPCSVCLGKGPRRRSVKIGERGSLESSRQRCVGLVGFCKVYPWCWIYPGHLALSLISFSASLSHIRIMITCFNLGTLNILCAASWLPFVGKLVLHILIEISWAVRRLIIYY